MGIFKYTYMSHTYLLIHPLQLSLVLTRIGLRSRANLMIIRAAVDSNADGYLDYFELERLRVMCRDALEESCSDTHPFRPWTKGYLHIHGGEMSKFESSMSNLHCCSYKLDCFDRYRSCRSSSNASDSGVEILSPTRTRKEHGREHDL